MAWCSRGRVKVESPTHYGLNLKVVGREEDLLDSPVEVPLTSRTEILQSNKLKCFTLNELKTATRDFHPDSMVCEREFSCVYKGWIDEHTLAPTKPGIGFAISVKRLNQESNQLGLNEWLTEINYLGQLHHPNLVKFIGYCIEDNFRFLVYEFFTKGSLLDNLFTKDSNFQPLTWKIRMNIALDVAKCLAFLHNDEVEVIYRNFKTSKILIDSNHNAKLYSFRSARDIPEIDMLDPDMIYMGRRTHIYAAPEYIQAGHLTKMSDVYNFGVVLLEIMSGKRALDNNRSYREYSLVDWAKRLNKDKIYQFMDSHIEGQYSSHEAMKVANIAIQCVNIRPESRPKMDDVVRLLEQP